ncbi:MAG: tyrosine-type recombinase/integrase [Bacteroidota bacterium]|nr:tyrosine-type recombinase/integrase [Bacteroidota bacterium]
MKSLVLQSSHYQYLEKSYREYLQILGYAVPTVNTWTVHAREFFHYLEQHNIRQITAVSSRHADDFIDYIKTRKSKRSGGGGLSSSHINSIINAVNSFARFLNSTGKYILDISPQREFTDTAERTILTVDEIRALYEATFLPHRESGPALGQRDRAILAVFYGCGLRRSEGRALNITDIDLHQRLVFVRKGKGNKQRYVPIAGKHASDIKSYITEGRPWFLYDHANNYHNVRHGRPYEKKLCADERAFFISQHGGRMQDFYGRLDVMRQRAEIGKNITPHGLRHSIATHLLQSGMDIEEIARFLGHSSLSSTQIYTHIVNQHPDHGTAERL